MARRTRVKYRGHKKYHYLIRSHTGQFLNWENIHRATRADAAHQATFIPSGQGRVFLGDYRTPAEKRRNAFTFAGHRPTRRKYHKRRLVFRLPLMQR